MLSLHTQWRFYMWVDCAQYALNRRLGGFQSWSGHWRRDKSLTVDKFMELNHSSLDVQPITQSLYHLSYPTSHWHWVDEKVFQPRIAVCLSVSEKLSITCPSLDHLSSTFILFSTQLLGCLYVMLLKTSELSYQCVRFNLCFRFQFTKQICFIFMNNIDHSLEFQLRWAAEILNNLYQSLGHSCSWYMTKTSGHVPTIKECGLAWQ
jgi:hypothetical protein